MVVQGFTCLMKPMKHMSHAMFLSPSHSTPHFPQGYGAILGVFLVFLFFTKILNDVQGKRDREERGEDRNR